MIASTDVVGWTYQGDIYCAAHKPDVVCSDSAFDEVGGGCVCEDATPVFAQDVEDTDCCSKCGHLLMGG